MSGPPVHQGQARQSPAALPPSCGRTWHLFALLWQPSVRQTEEAMPGPETTLPPGHPDQTESETAQLAAGFKEYEDGKHRRYELLFKVNGAAFAIAALAFKPESKDFIQSVVGLPTLGVGMMLLTLLLGADIFAFGWDMKQMETRFGKETLSAAP